MKIATWNVNGLRARIDYLKLWLEQRQPDVVGLQELKMTEDQFPYADFEALGYHAAVHGQKSWNGVAVLSREPAELVQAGLPGEEEMGSRLITVDVGGLRFTTVYCPNGKTLEHEDYGRKLAWYETLTSHLADDVTTGRVICGDFNICPAPIDCWMGEKAEGHIFNTEAERVRLGSLQQLGFVDLFRALKPDEQVFSWWDYRGGAFHRKQGLRIDHIYATGDVLARTDDVNTDRDFRKKQDGLTASDHAPVIADLRT